MMPRKAVSLSRALNSVLDLIGNTPLVRLEALEAAGSARVLAKLESANPSGSVKDRVALAMVEDAEARGALVPGSTIVEPSAGNMGAALAMVAAAKGYRFDVVMPEGVPLERRRLVSRYGASVHLTPSALGMDGANVAVRRMVEQDRTLVRLDQFTSAANPRAHREGTGREILEATQGNVDAFVAAVGSGGTVTGVGAALKGANASVLVVAVEPATSPLLSQGWAGDHEIPGIGADFVPPILDRDIIDEVMTVTSQEATETTLRLGREMGLLVGLSSGANVFVALKLAERLGPGKSVVTVLPDTGERYPYLGQ
jgi:cysteine synthase A